VYRNSERDELCKLLSANGIAAEAVDASNVWLDRQTVKVMTVHAAKGLDFPSIYLYRFMAERTEPSEQRALMYVALTRSSFRLTVMCDRSTVSPLLEDLEPSTYRLTGTARGVLWS
jgi:ATP-dependent exoDNAse (exonuclease V) beta subunit